MSDSGLRLPTGKVSEEEMRRLIKARDDARADWEKVGFCMEGDEYQAFRRAAYNLKRARRANAGTGEQK